MITNNEIADKKNEVTMLRLERDEMLIRRQLAERQSELDDTSPIERSVIGNLRSINTRQHTQIREHCETIGALGATIRELEERDALKTTAIDALQNDLTQQIKTDELLRGCIGVLKAELSNAKSAIVMKNGVINEKNKTTDELTEQRDSEYETAKALRRVIDGIEQDVTKYKTTIDELNETIRDLRMAASDMLDTIDECARGEAEDSRVLMQVVGWVKQWDTTPPAYRSSHLDMRQIATIVEDYLAAPESPVVTLKTPSMGTRVVSKNEEAHIIDEVKMRAVHALIGCGDKWVLHLGVDAGEVAKYNQTIDDLTQNIEKLTHDLDARNTVIKDFKAIEQKETDRLHETIEGNGKTIDELNDMYCDACGKLEQIEKVTKDAISYVHIDEITKIIQEE